MTGSSRSPVPVCSHEFSNGEDTHFFGHFFPVRFLRYTFHLPMGFHTHDAKPGVYTLENTAERPIPGKSIIPIDLFFTEGSDKYQACNRRSSVSTSTSLSMPAIQTRFTDEVWPLTMVTDDFETSRTDDISAIIAVFALPSTGGARMLHPTAERQTFTPAGNSSRRAPAWTSSMQYTQPSPFSTAHAADIIIIVYKSIMWPDSNKHGSSVACAVHHLF